MSGPRKSKSSRAGSPQINRHFHFLAPTLRLVNPREPDTQEPLSNNSSKNLLSGRRASDQDQWDLLDRWSSLSTREQDVTYFTCQGYTNHEIALQLGVSERTVKSYLKYVFFKINVPNKVELRLKFANFDFTQYYT